MRTKPRQTELSNNAGEGTVRFHLPEDSSEPKLADTFCEQFFDAVEVAPAQPGLTD